MRESKRYLLVKGKVEDAERAIKDFIGSLGMAKASPKFIKKGKNEGILAVNREALNHVRASFAVWPEKIEVLRVSGTLKGLKHHKI